MSELDNTISVEFPFRGEWIALNTPAKQIPSHGTDQFGQRYAYDFIQIDWNKKGINFCRDKNLFKLYLWGIPLKSCLCWGQNVYAPFDGKVIKTYDNCKERRRIQLILEIIRIYAFSYIKNPNKITLSDIAGNYIIIQGENNVFAFFAHLQKGSINVKENQEIKTGEIIGKVGHSGNSTMPHLHFQLMDSANVFEAKGIPCSFLKYQQFENDKWITVTNGIPNFKDRIKNCD